MLIKFKGHRRSLNRTMEQRTFSQAEYSRKKRQTRRYRFLAEIERITPWQCLKDEIEPHYPKPAGPDRPLRGLETMLRMYIAQQYFGLSDEGIEDAIYDSMATRNSVGIDLNVEQEPDVSNLLNMQGLILKEGAVVDATIISAPSSTKNEDKERDPEMHQTKKGNEWHFGMKAHIDVDAHSGEVHTLKTTPPTQPTLTMITTCCMVKKSWCLPMQATKVLRNESM